MSKHTLLDSSLSRRDALRLLGATGAASLLGASAQNALMPWLVNTPHATDYENLVARLVQPSLYAASPLQETKPVSEMNCVGRPALTEGPFFVDERLNRSDIRSDPSNNTVKPGTPIKIKFNIFRTSGSTCTPLVGAWVDLWHCDATGGYSDVSGQGNPNNLGQKFLRGYQITDANGAVEFTTIYPGWYSGRTVHFHYKIRLFAGTTRTYEFTSQLMFDDTLTDQVFTQSPYSARPNRNTRNSNDNIYQSGGSTLLLNLTSDGQGGYTTTYDVSLTGLPATTSALSPVSGASYTSGAALSSESIASVFGNGLASTTATAPANTANQLPTTLGDVTVTVRDANGTTRNAPLFYVSPVQINAQIPTGTSLGTATLTALQGGTNVAQGTVAIETVAPGIFTANANGAGVAAALIQRVRGDGSQSYEAVWQYDAAQQKAVAVPIDLGPATDNVYLLLFGTGFRARTALSSVVCSIGGASAEVSYAGAQGQYMGLDQANVLIPRSLIGRGEAELLFRVDAKLANTVTINIK
jgi:uncharacterized protein (TIGR03437 family)